MMTDDYKALWEENAWVVDDLKSKGVNLSRERTMEFAHKFSDESAVQSFADEILRKGPEGRVNRRG